MRHKHSPVRDVCLQHQAGHCFKGALCKLVHYTTVCEEASIPKEVRQEYVRKMVQHYKTLLLEDEDVQRFHVEMFPK